MSESVDRRHFKAEFFNRAAKRTLAKAQPNGSNWRDCDLQRDAYSDRFQAAVI
jgi:hypothetical protein